MSQEIEKVGDENHRYNPVIAFSIDHILSFGWGLRPFDTKMDHISSNVD